MNILLLISFIVIETGLVVFTFMENRQKKVWVRNRLLVNVLEILVFILFALFPGVDFGFRFKGLIAVLTVRLLVSGIIYFCRRKAEGDKKKIAAVVSAVLSVILLTMGLSVSFIFADYHGRTVTGAYKVASTEAILIDKSRVEVFENDGSYREVPVHFYYPGNAKEGERFPVVVFSHGAFGYYESNTSTYMELASNGYVVVSLDHPYHSFFSKDSEGKTIIVNTKFINDVMYINSGDAPESEIAELSATWLKLRTDDISFVIDTLEAYNAINGFSDAWYINGEKNLLTDALAMMNTDKIGLMGHSLGGAAAEALGRVRSDIDAVVDLDGTMFGEQQGLVKCEEYEFEGIVYHEKYVINEVPYPVALLSIDNQEHHNSRVNAVKQGVPYANNVVMDNALDGYDTYFVNAGHMNFTDLPLFSPVLANMLGTGPIDAGKCVDEMNRVLLEFFNSKLKNMGSFRVEECYGD